MTIKRVNYRKLAFESYDPLCAHCGFGIPSVLEIAHIDGNRNNNEVGNLVILCPNCHKMHDLDLISTETIIQMRDRPKIVDWSKRMKDAGKKAAHTRKWRNAGRKAAETRRKNKEKSNPYKASSCQEQKYPLTEKGYCKNFFRHKHGVAATDSAMPTWFPRNRFAESCSAPNTY